MAALLEIDDLECGYDRTILGPFSAEVPTGAFLLIEGPNGVGKSTLLKTLIGLIAPRSGDFRWGVPSADLRYVPQTRTLDPLLPATVEDVLSTGLMRGGCWHIFKQPASRQPVHDALRLVGLEDHRHHLFRELSEGQKQLVLLARALIGEPKVVLLDEPAASMDPQREREAIAVLKRHQREFDTSVIMIAHGSLDARRAADSLLTIDRRKRIELVTDPSWSEVVEEDV